MARVKDWSRPYFQLLILILSVGLTVKYDYAKVLLDVITKVGFENADLPTMLRVAYAYGRIPLSIVIVGFILITIRKLNGKAVLNSNNNMYHDHIYAGYVICRYLLGYSECSLKLVPIPMQYKLVINGLFAKYVYSDGIHKAKDETVKIVKNNDQSYTSTINLVISDTFKITSGQLPGTVLNFTTIEIDRSSDDHMRYDSDELLKNVISVVRGLPENVVEVNIFATTNPTNTYKIASEAFATGGRDRIQHIFVFPQDRTGARNFARTGMKIY